MQRACMISSTNHLICLIWPDSEASIRHLIGNGIDLVAVTGVACFRKAGKQAGLWQHGHWLDCFPSYSVLVLYQFFLFFFLDTEYLRLSLVLVWIFYFLFLSLDLVVCWSFDYWFILLLLLCLPACGLPLATYLALSCFCHIHIVCQSAGIFYPFYSFFSFFFFFFSGLWPTDQLVD